MAITERIEQGDIVVMRDGSMDVEMVTVIERDGVEIHRFSEKKTVELGDDEATARSAKAAALANAMWSDDDREANAQLKADRKAAAEANAQLKADRKAAAEAED